MQTFHRLRKGKESLLTILEEAELPEAVYNSNAIENSTLTLDETEKILLHQELPLHHGQREIFETINLARVTEYLHQKVQKRQALTETIMLFVHRTLLSHINDAIAGRFRQKGEYVRVGRHIAPAPEHISLLMQNLLQKYRDDTVHILQRIVEFHLEFERIRPFCDGNGRVGRALLQYQLKAHGYPPIIIRNKGKSMYYSAFQAYDDDRATKGLERMVVVLLKESLHKRITYLRGDVIVRLSDIGKEDRHHSPQSLAKAAKNQSLPAFRERGQWKVGRRMFREWLRK